jgi:enoyl-CoA hydratase/carnithine racemase
MGPWKTVRVSVEDGIAWVELNRPEKRNAMNPELNEEMVSVLVELDADERCGVLVLTGAGAAFSAGSSARRAQGPPRSRSTSAATKPSSSSAKSRPASR